LKRDGSNALLVTKLISGDDLLDVLIKETVLAFTFLEVLFGVDEEHVVWLLAFLEHQNAHWDAGGIKQIGGQADNRINVPICQQLVRIRSSAPPRNSTPWGRMMAMTPSSFR
jgi:hypothetical protein